MWNKRADTVVHEVEPYNAEPVPAALADGALTGEDTFYSRNHGPIPDIDPARWRLTVADGHGASRSFSLDELRQEFDEISVVATLQCAGNRRAGLMAVREIPGEDPWTQCATSTARWNGVSLADLLRSCGVREDTPGHVEFVGPDVSDLATPPQRYGSSIELAKAMSAETLLAWGMNGQPLPQVHGGPVRVVVPGYIGARSVKWVDEITVRDSPSDNWFQRVAYRVLPVDADPDSAGPGDGISLSSVALNCDFLYPDPTTTVDRDEVRVGGYAFAGDDRAVSRVQVSIDDGDTWVEADLAESQGPWAWRHWSAVVPLDAPEVELCVRAWDGAAATQPASAAELWNPKGYANNSWGRLTVRRAPVTT